MGEEFFKFGWKILGIVHPFYCHRLRGSNQLDSWNKQVNVQMHLPNVTNLNEQLSFYGTHWPFLVNARRVGLTVKRQSFYFSSKNIAIPLKFCTCQEILINIWHQFWALKHFSGGYSGFNILEHTLKYITSEVLQTP